MSGMGRGYEDGIQKMVWTGFKWLQGKPKDIFSGTQTYENVYGICETPKSLDDMRKILLEVNPGCSGAQYQCAISHLKYLHENGYDKWYDEMRTARTKEDQYDFDMERMELLPYLTPEQQWKKEQ